MEELEPRPTKDIDRHRLRRGRPPATAPGRRQERPILVLNCGGELRRHLGELGIGARDSAQAATFADPIEFRHRLVQTAPRALQGRDVRFPAATHTEA